MTKLLYLLTLGAALGTVPLISCAPGEWHVGTGDKLNNLVQWKADALARREARKLRKHKVQLPAPVPDELATYF